MANGQTGDLPDRPHVAFVMEQHVGHRTYYENLRAFVDLDPRVCATWAPITYRPDADQWTWLSLFPGRLRGPWYGRAQVQQALRQPSFDMVFFNTQVPATLGGAVARRRPYVISTDITPIQYDQMGALYHHQGDRPGLLKWYKHRVNIQTLRHAAMLLPWTHWVKDSLIKDYGIPAEHISVVPGGVNTEFWTPKPAHQKRKRLKILFVGGDFFRKGGEVLLRAFHQLLSGTAELHIVTRSEIACTENVHVYRDMRPNTPELLALYHHCDVFVLPTGADAFGFVLVEAMACGLPVITTNVGGIAEVVDSGETGFLIRPDDVSALRLHLIRLAQDEPLVRQMGAAARERAVKHFDAKTQAKAIVEVLCQIADKHRAWQEAARWL